MSDDFLAAWLGVSAPDSSEIVSAEGAASSAASSGLAVAIRPDVGTNADAAVGSLFQHVGKGKSVFKKGRVSAAEKRLLSLHNGDVIASTTPVKDPSVAIPESLDGSCGSERLQMALQGMDQHLVALMERPSMVLQNGNLQLALARALSVVHRESYQADGEVEEAANMFLNPRY
eukprot:3462028-Amphidinium_carterae.2